MDMPDRREFLQTMSMLAAAPVVAATGMSAAAQEERKMGPEMARLLTEMLQARYGKQIDEAYYKSMQPRIAGNFANAEALRRVPLVNSDEPDFTFFAEPATS